MASARITFHPERRGSGTIKLTETHWGYILREAAGPLGGAAVAELALRGFGLLLVMSAYGQWLLPSGLFTPDTGDRILLSAVLASAGGAIYFLANRGLQPEIHVDTAEREFRFAHRNGRGAVRIGRRLPFETVESVFVRRHEGAPAEIRLRIRGIEDAVHLVSGAANDLNLMHARLCKDLKSPHERVEARLRVRPPRKLAVRAPVRKTA